MSDLGDEDRDILQVFRKGGGGGGGACRAFEDLVDNMSKGRLEEFVGRMRHKAQDANDAFTHCKMLFSHKRTRGMAVLLCVELLQAGKLSDKAAFRCIPEIRAAIVDCAYVGGIGVGAGNACSEEEEAGERIDFLTRLCTDILGFLCQDDANNDHCDASGGGGGGRVQRRVPNDRNYGGSTSVENFVKALELLPAALQGLENQASPEAGNPAGRESSGDNRRVANGGSLNAAAVRTRIISETLGSSWPACCVLPLLRVLTEISLTESEKAQACRHVVDSSSEIPEEHTIGLIEVLLSYAEKYGDMRWLEAGRCVLERTPERLLGDAYCVVEISLHNGSRLMGLINSTLGLNDAAQDHRSRKSGDDHQHSAANEARLSQLTVTDFFLMLIVAQNDLFRERVMDTMIFELVRLCSSVTGDNFKENQGFQHAKKLLSDVVRLPEAEKYSCILLELGIRMLGEGSQGKSASTPRMQATCNVGQHLLYDLFHWRTHVRAELIATVFNSLVENKNTEDRFSAGCVHVLHRISSSHLLSLRDSASTVVQCMSFLWLLPLPTARALLSAFLPLCKHSQLFCDRIMVLFRKELYGSDVSKRRLAVYGVCLLLTHTERGVLCDTQQQIEIIVSLKPIFASHFDVRVEFFEGLQKLLSGTKQNVGYNALDVDAQNLLREMVVSRMRRYLVESESTSASGKGKAAAIDEKSLILRIEPCFEYSQESGTGASKQVRCSESLAHLVKCVASMAGSDQSARAVMKALAEQLSSPTSVSALMTGHDCPGHTSKNDAQDGAQQRLPLSPSNRLMVLLPLYEIFIDFCACDRPPLWALPLGSANSPNIKGSEMWLDIYSTLSAITAPSASVDLSFETQNDSLDRILTSIELVCSPQGQPVDRDVARARSLRLSPVICRLVRRFLDLSAKQEKYSWSQDDDDQRNDEDMEMPSSSSQPHSNARSSSEKGSNLAEMAPRVLHCVLFLYENTKPPLNAPSRRASRTTRSSAAPCSIDADVLDKSFAPSFARELVEQFEQRTKYFDLGDDFGFDEKSYHRMRDLLLEAIRVCVVSGACSTIEIWNGLHPNEAPSGEPISIQVVEQFSSRLEAEIELEVVPLSTLLAYLDLMQAIQENCPSSGSGMSEHSIADWSQVSRDLMSMLCRSCSTAPSQALRRVITFSINALKPSTAVMLSVQVISHVCATICDEHMIVEEPAEIDSSFTLNLLDWEMPELDTTTGTSAIGVCLRHLCNFFSEPVNLERPLSVVLHTATVVTKAFRLVDKVSAGTRSLMIRLARRILSHSTKLTSSLIRLEGLQKLVLHAALLFTRQALLGADVLCGTLPAESTAAAAQIRHAALKCGFQAKSLISTSRVEAIMSGGVLDVARELESVFTSLQKGGGGAEVVVPEPGEVAVARKSRRKKRRIRSRNAYVDAALDEEDGSDGYGDLEDFIVCKDGIEY